MEQLNRKSKLGKWEGEFFHKNSPLAKNAKLDLLNRNKLARDGRIDMDFLLRDFQQFWRESSEIEKIYIRKETVQGKEISLAGC